MKEYFARLCNYFQLINFHDHPPVAFFGDLTACQ